VHPLRGPNIEEFGVRFPPLSDAYDLDLRRRTHRAWATLGLDKQRRLHEGVYAFVGGPTYVFSTYISIPTLADTDSHSYETRAECRMLSSLGADVVGMSTVPEVIVARHAGMRVLAFSLVTNVSILEAGELGNDAAIQNMSSAELTTHLSKGKANHEEVLEAGREAAKDMQELVKEILAGLHGES
jgi:purine-nucleoside phosphorylase